MKTSELQGAALDWAVAKCEGVEVVRVKHGRATFIDPADDGALNEMPINYSTDWAQGGAIIEREKISLEFLAGAGDAGADVWVATRTEGSAVFEMEGWTPLKAAMRCYVASKLGDEVEIPEELRGDSK